MAGLIEQVEPTGCQYCENYRGDVEGEHRCRHNIRWFNFLTGEYAANGGRETDRCELINRDGACTLFKQNPDRKRR